MKLPVIEGTIRRRLLVNFRVDAEVMRSLLPKPFEPKLHRGAAMAGICLIRLEQIRPRHFPAAVGFASENAAHRMAVTWRDEAGAAQEGVFIPRRDTGSFWNHLAGGRIFPGEHHWAKFRVRSQGDSIDLAMASRDRQVEVRVRGRADAALPAGSGFASLAEASAFYESGSLGYSVTRQAHRFDGISLRTRHWKVEAFAVEEVFSSYFADETRFPKGSVEFDCALLMRDLVHEWRSAPDLPAAPGAGSVA